MLAKLIFDFFSNTITAARTRVCMERVWMEKTHSLVPAMIITWDGIVQVKYFTTIICN